MNVFNLGAMRESDGVRYLVKFKGENEAKAISSAEATKYPVPIIEFLQSKIIWENDNQDSHSLATISQMQGVPTKCICKYEIFEMLQISLNHSFGLYLIQCSFFFNLDATKEKDTLLYFLELEKGAVNIISAEEAITSYAAFVLNYLESCIE